ncbi:MAG: Imm63 family immunity protein [Pyrinomonadaceae bacterium]
MPKNELIELLQEEFDGLCRKISPRDTPYRFPTVRSDFGFEHLEIIEDEYHLVVTERGLELSRQITKSKDEVLYWMVSSLAWGLASKFELHNRIEGQDFRRLFFAKQVEYLGRVNKYWAEEKQKEFDEVLKKHPFNDSL